MISTSATAAGMCAFIDQSPSPFHVCDSVATQLGDAGYRELYETDRWPGDAGAFFVRRGGSIVAWDSRKAKVDSGFRIVGGHTDSPNLRLKQHPELRSAGLSMVGLEPYGGAWLHTWMDRDLGVSGRISVRGPDGVQQKLVRVDDAVLRIPQLSIHLSDDRKGIHPDPQSHLNALWAVGDRGAGFIEHVVASAGVDVNSVLGWELMVHTLTPSAVIGYNNDLVSAPRLDNQGTCYTATRALVDAEDTRTVPVLALFDHEEVGSGSERGAASDFLGTVLERIVLSGNGSRDDFLRVMSASACASGDMAHATHPNHAGRHEPAHQIALNGGPVLKVNQNLRYASDAESEAVFAVACADAGVPMQRYVHRADLPCGSTIGPITATRTGVLTVDVGAPQLAMHSASELMGADDVPMYSAALQAFLRG